MRLWFSRRVLKNPVYLAYTIFQVLPKKQNIANYVANLALTKQTLFFVCLSFARLLLLPTSTQYPVGSPTLKSQNFDGFLTFLSGF